jgi:hypothetical protein
MCNLPTTDYQLVFHHVATEGDTLFSYVNADWASDINDWKSMSRFLCMLAGSAMSWHSKKQGSVAPSSTKAEYITTAHATKEIIWLWRLLIDLLQHITSPTSLRINNQLAIAITKNPEFHDRTKHIEVCHHFLHLKVEQQEISLDYIPTNAQPADALTKELAKDKHDHFMSEMGVCCAM